MLDLSPFPGVKSLHELTIGEITLFISVDLQGVTHYRAFGPRNWMRAGASRDAEELIARARRLCIQQNAEFERMGPEPQRCSPECEECAEMYPEG